MVSTGSHALDLASSDGALITTITTLVARGGQERFTAEAFENTFGGHQRETHHLATLLIEQEGGLNFLISQFSDAGTLEAWRRSSAHRQMVEAFEAHSLRELCTIDQPVVRISVPTATSGPKWKSLLTSWVVTFPLLLVIVRLLDFATPQASMPARIAMTSIIISVAITWLIAPFMQRLTRTWRLKDQQMKIIVVGGAAARPTPSPNA